MTVRILSVVFAVFAVGALLGTRDDGVASVAPYRLDETFGTGGVATANFTPGNRAFALALQPDGDRKSVV